MLTIIKRIGSFFDLLQRGWMNPKTIRILGSGVAVGYIGALVVIDLNIRGYLPSNLAAITPANHLAAIDLAFTLFLVFEVITLVFNLARSIADSVGKQFEIFSLILLRDTFKEFSRFDEPLMWNDINEVVGNMAAAALGALLIFFILGIYYRAQSHKDIVKDEIDFDAFVNSKKVISLLLLISFAFIAIENIRGYLSNSSVGSAFESFYTILIFSDVLIVLISLRYSSKYHVAFRNSGFAVATVFIRLAMIAPVQIRAAIGVGTVLFAVGITYAYNYFRGEYSKT